MTSEYYYTAPLASIDESDVGAAHWVRSDTLRSTGISVYPETTYARVYMSAQGSVVFGRIPKTEVPALATALLRAVGLEEDARTLETNILARKAIEEDERLNQRRKEHLQVLGSTYPTYDSLALDSVTRKAVDRIIELEDKLAEKN